MSATRTIAVLGVLALWAPAARAQDPDPAAAASPRYRFTVTERLPVTASSTLTIPAEDFELRPLESGGQMLEAVPSMLTAQHTGGGKAEQYFLRGFDADHGTDVLVYFDGVPINLRSHAHGQGYLDLHFVTKEAIERLDAYKGPYFAQFGDFATAATVEYVPYETLDESFVRYEGGMFDTHRSVAVLSPRFGAFGGDDPSADGMVSFEAYHTNGPFKDNEDLWRFSLFGKGSVELRPALRLSGHALAYGADWNASGLLPDRLVQGGPIGRWDSLDPSEGGDSRRFQGKLQLDWSPSPLRHLTANVYLAHYDLDLYSNFTYALDDPVAGDGIVQRDDRIYTGGRIEYRHLVDAERPALFRLGVETRYDDARVKRGNQTRRKVREFTNDDDVRQLSVGPYVEAEFQPLEWVRFVGGLRFEYFRYDVDDNLGRTDQGGSDDTIWLPKANLVLAPFGPASPWEKEFELARNLELFLNFGRGFHSNDARAKLAGGKSLPAAMGYEAGVRTAWGSRFEVALSLWALDLDDELVFAGDAGTTESAGQSRRRGVELTALVWPLEWLYVRGDVAYTDTELDDTNRPIPQAPRFIAKGAVGVRLGGFAAELSGRHFGKRYKDEESYSPKLHDYTVFDLGARYRWRRFEVGLSVENLFGTDWRSSEFFYASCAPNEVGVDPRCPSAGGGQGIDDFHFTPGNRRNVRGWASVYF